MLAAKTEPILAANNLDVPILAANNLDVPILEANFSCANIGSQYLCVF